MTMTEFNRAPSRAAALAATEEVRITMSGLPYLVLRRDTAPLTIAGQMRASGQIRPRKLASEWKPRPLGAPDPDHMAAYDAFMDERARDA